MCHYQRIDKITHMRVLSKWLLEMYMGEYVPARWKGESTVGEGCDMLVTSKVDALLQLYNG